MGELRSRNATVRYSKVTSPASSQEAICRVVRFLEIGAVHAVHIHVDDDRDGLARGCRSDACRNRSVVVGLGGASGSVVNVHVKRLRRLQRRWWRSG